MKSTLKVFARYLLTFFFVIAGVNHFVMPDFYLRMMPPFLPFHLELIFVSGVFEIFLGLLVLSRKYRFAAGIGLVLLLLAVFPANIYAALNPHIFSNMPEWVLWFRLPFQFLFIAWVLWVTVEKKT